MNQPVSPYGHFKANYKNRVALGMGGFGVVYKAKHRTSGTVDAVKEVLIETEEDYKESLREVQALQTLEHSSIVPYKTSWLEKMKRNDDKTFPINLYIVMGLGTGTLEKWLEDHRDEQSRKLFSINLWLEQLVDGVRHIHGKGMMHRDLKPENILLFSDCNRYTLKISDFGTAKNTVDGNGDGKHTGGVGSYQYMAPELWEQNRENYNEAVDVYSLGLILMEILYPMNGGQTNSVCTARFEGQIHPKSWLDRWRKMEIPRAFLFCLTDKNPDTRLKYMDILARGGSDPNRTGARLFFSPKKPNPSFWPTINRKISAELDDFIEKEASKVPDESYRETGHSKKEYEELGTIGSGGFGVVLKARHRADNMYAVKQVQIEEEEHWDEFLREVMRHTARENPNIMGYNDWWLEKATGCLYIRMVLGNETLEKLLREHPNEEDRGSKTMRIFMQHLRDGLDYIYENGMLIYFSFMMGTPPF